MQLSFLSFVLSARARVCALRNSIKTWRAQKPARINAGAVQSSTNETSLNEVPANRRQKGLLMAAIVTALAGGANAANVNGEAFRKSEEARKFDNGVRLGKMHPYMRPKVRAIIRDLESHGYQPLIDFQVWRTREQQAKLLKRGVSRVAYSFHMVTDRDAKGRAIPASLAADITHKPWGWNSPTSYWLKLASSAESHGLATGIDWYLGSVDRGRIHLEIASENWGAKIKTHPRWDPAHVQPRQQIITVAQAQRGVRPR